MANFFKTNNELIKYLELLKPLSLNNLKKRKEILLKINENNLNGIFNYSTLSKRLVNNIFK